MIRSLFIAIFFIGVAFSCAPKVEVDSEQSIDVLSKEDFSKLLADIQLVESHGTVLRIEQPYYKDSLNHYFSEVFKKHNISSEDFYFSLKYYSANPDQMEVIYQLSLAILEEKEKELEDELVISSPISPISKQQVGDAILSTPFYNMMLEDSITILPQFKDSLLQYFIHNEQVLFDMNTNLASFQFSFNMNTSKPLMYIQLRKYIKAIIEKRETGE